MKKTTLYILLVIALLTTGCTKIITEASIPKQHGTINLKYKSQKQEDKVNKTIAIVSPTFIDHEKLSRSINDQPHNISGLDKFNGPDDEYFDKKYKSRFVSSFNATMFEILSKKGFLTKGPFETFDDITYAEKKQIYLTIIPHFNFSLNRQVIKNKCNTELCHEEGILQLGGSVDLKVIEPLTKQAILNKRINLSDFNIEESYTYDIANIEDDGYTNKYDFKYDYYTPNQLKNDFDLAMTNVINNFYKKAFEKIQKYISRDELIDQKNDITTLKNLKRF